MLKDKVFQRRAIFSTADDWVVFSWITFMHLGAIAAFWTFNWKALGVCLFLWWLTGGVGMSETQRMAQFMKKDSANIRDGWSVGNELEGTTIRIERDGPIKENIRFDHI